MRDLSLLVDGDRLAKYTRLAVLVYVTILLLLLLGSSGNVGPDGKPVGADFITFWSAGRLSWTGNPLAAFDATQIFAMQRGAAPGYEHVFLWHYPPTFQLLTLPLSVPPYLLAYYLFVTASLVAFVTALRPIVPWREQAVLLLALPGTLVCILHGQNSLISAALLATAIISIDRRPLLAGVCIGLLAFKPQLAVLFPIVLAITGRWRVFAAAGVTLAIYVAATLVVFGQAQWQAFFANLGVVREVVEAGQLPWGKMPSAFVFLRKLGVPQDMAYAGQALVAASVMVTVALVWWRKGPTLMAGAALITGTLLLTPYTFDYEMAILAVPLAIVARRLVRRGATRTDKLALLLIALSPLAMGPLVDATGLQLGFLALAALFVWTIRLAHEPAVAIAALIPVSRLPLSLPTSPAP